MMITWCHLPWGFSVSFQSILTFSDKWTPVEEHQKILCMEIKKRRKNMFAPVVGILTFKCFFIFYWLKNEPTNVFLSDQVMINLSNQWTKMSPFNPYLHRRKIYSCFFFFFLYVSHFYFKMLINKAYTPTSSYKGGITNIVHSVGSIAQCRKSWLTNICSKIKFLRKIITHIHFR